MGRADDFSALQRRSTRLPRDPGKKNSCKSMFKEFSQNLRRKEKGEKRQMHFIKKTVIFHSKISFAEHPI